jgi:hypothetical protein
VRDQAPVLVVGDQALAAGLLDLQAGHLRLLPLLELREDLARLVERGGDRRQFAVDRDGRARAPD